MRKVKDRSKLKDEENVKLDNAAFCKVLKIAVATAIVKCKPNNLSSEDFTKILRKSYAEGQKQLVKHNEELRQMVCDLSKELVELRKVDSFKGQYGTQHAGTASPHLGNLATNAQGKLSLYSMGRCSEMRFISATIALTRLLPHSKPPCGSVLDLHRWEESFGKAIRDTLKTLVMDFSSSTALPDLAIHNGLECIVTLADNSSHGPLEQDVLNAVSTVINVTTQKLLIDTDLISFDKANLLHQHLVHLANSEHLRPGILIWLTRCLEEFSLILIRNNSHIPVGGLERICFIFEILEHFLEQEFFRVFYKEQTQVCLDPGVLASLEDSLKNCLLQEAISEEFPLYQHYVWQVGLYLHHIHVSRPASIRFKDT